MKFVDENNKKLKWYNRNYLWVVTILYVALNILIFYLLKGENLFFTWFSSEWRFLNSVRLWILNIGNCYSHFDWEHVLQNMLALSVCAFYLERKMGSVNFAMLLLSLTIIVSPIVGFGFEATSWKGNSGIWFALVGYMLIDYLFSLRKSERNMTNLIVGAVCLFLEWFRIGFYDKHGGGIGWVFAPYQLVMNSGHYTAFIVGVVFALVICVVKAQFKMKRIRVVSDVENANNSKSEIFCKRFAIIILSLIIFVFAWAPVYFVLQAQRDWCVKLSVDCNIDEYDLEISLEEVKELVIKTSGPYENIEYNSYDVVSAWIKKFNLTYNYSDLQILIYDKLQDCNYASVTISEGGSPTYMNPWGFKDFLGVDLVIRITV